MLEFDVLETEHKQFALLDGHMRLRVRLRLMGSAEVADSKSGTTYTARAVEGEIHLFDQSGNLVGTLA